MKTVAMLFLAGILSALAPEVSAAQSQLRAFNATGELRVRITSPVDDVDETTPITKGCIEIQEGPYTIPDVGRHFVLTRLSVHFADFTIRTHSLKNAMGLQVVAAQARDAVNWWGLEEQPGVFKIDITHTNDHRYGEPTFVMGAKVDPEYFNGPHNDDVPPFFLGEERVSQDITGSLDLNAGTLAATAVFHRTHEIIPFLEAKRTYTITLSGALVPTGASCGTSGGAPQDKSTTSSVLRVR
jgi:hypothetical protein